MIKTRPFGIAKEDFINWFLKGANRILNRSSKTDDFAWQRYHRHYQEELSSVKDRYLAILGPNDYSYSSGKLSRNKAKLPLHPNHHLLYETILQLRPDSLLEGGCGGGDHLWNLSVLMPETRLHGRDLSLDQLQFLRLRHSTLKADVQQLDLTTAISHLSTPVDLAYTQAVLMHIQGGPRHVVALANLFAMATKQVVLMENWKRHEFMADIQHLYSEGRLPWDNIYFYFRSLEDSSSPKIMVVSSSRLSYEPLADYRLLLEA